MSDGTGTESAADRDERAERGMQLGLSEISYSHLTAAAVAHATRAPVAADPTWATIGPRNVGGRITALGQHEDNPLVIYAGSAHGGLWVSRDAGDTWAHVGQPQDNFAVGTIAVPPGIAGEVIVGTGSMAASYVSGLGIFKVTVPANPEDAVFARLAGPPPVGSSPGDETLAGAALRYTRIRLDPDNPARFWAASQTGLWRYEPRAGRGFVRDFPIADNPPGAPAFATDLEDLSIWPDYCTDVLVARDPREDARVTENGAERARYLVIYVGVSDKKDGGVFRGRFDRKHATIEWSPVLGVPNADLYAGGRLFTRVRLALCQSRPSVVYTVFASNPGSGLAEHNHASFVFCSEDNGDTWARRGRIPRAFLYEDAAGQPPCDGQADYDLVLEVDPRSPDVLVCGEIDVCKSDDGGRTWSTILDWQNYDLGDYAQHADQHIAMFDRADHRRLWVGNDGGLSLARDLRRPPGEPRYWRKRSHAIIAGQFQDVTVHPSPQRNFFCGGGLQDNGTYVSVGGPTWLHVGWADGGAMAFHATIPDYFIVGQYSVVNLSSLTAAVSPIANPILADLPFPDRRMFVQLNSLPIPGTGPFVAALEQDPTLAGQCLVGWTASAGESIAYIVPPPPPPPPGVLPAGLPLVGLTGAAGGIVSAGEDAQAVALGPVIAGPPQRVEGWIGTSFGQLLFSPDAFSPATWGRAPAPLPLLGGVPRVVTRISVHPTDSWLVAVATVPDFMGLPAAALAPLQRPITVRITATGAVGASQFTFHLGVGVPEAPSPTGPSVSLPGTLTTLFFTPGVFVAGDSWTVGPDGAVQAAPGNASAGGLAATVTPGGRIFLTYDRGSTWMDVSAPSAPLPRLDPDLSAISPGPVGALEWDRGSIPSPTRLFAGTLAGVYVLPDIPTSTRVALGTKPATIPLGKQIQLQANLVLTTDDPVDCTRAADWSSSNPAALTVTPSGLVSTAAGAASGEAATITVRRGTFTDTVDIVVTAAGAADALVAPAAFASPNVAVAWRPFGKSLPLTLVNDLTMVPGTRRLRAATFGRGIWDVDLAGDTKHRLYIRQTVIEDGRTYLRPAPLPLADDPRLPAGRVALDFTHAFDIRVDAPPYAFFDDVVDGVEFDEQLEVSDPVPAEDNYVYVQVHNSGTLSVPCVSVHLYAAACAADDVVNPIGGVATASPASLDGEAPAGAPITGFYGQPNFDPIFGSRWKRVDVVRVVGDVPPDAPRIARFTWTPDVALATKNVALLALCNGHLDPLPNTPAETWLSKFILAERRAALRIVHVAARPAASLYIRDGIADDTRVGGYPVGGRSPDIMVVHSDVGNPNETFKDFMARRSGDTVNKTGRNVVYVRVHNRRRFATKAKVKAFAIGLDDSNAPGPDPALWTELPPDPPVADVTVPASGVGYARFVFDDAPEPNVDHINKTYLLLALIKSEDDTDPLPNKDGVATVEAFWDLVARAVDSDNAAARAVPWVGEP